MISITIISIHNHLESSFLLAPPVFPLPPSFPFLFFFFLSKMSSVAPEPPSGSPPAIPVEGSREHIESLYISSKGDPKEHASCEKMVQTVLQANPVLRFMMDSLSKAGCSFSPSKHFVCAPCNSQNSIAGGFHDQSM